MFGGKEICVWRAGGWRLWQGLEEADELGGEVGLEAFDGGHGGGVGGFEGALGRGEVVGLLDLAFDEDGGGEDDTIGVVVAPCGEAAARGGWRCARGRCSARRDGGHRGLPCLHNSVCHRVLRRRA